MVKCSFSGENIPKGRGKMLVRNSGKVLYFIDNKSMKNFLKLKRKPQKTRWTQSARKLAEQRKPVKK